jgi:DNA-binding response OmpR family regulator
MPAPIGYLPGMNAEPIRLLVVEDEQSIASLLHEILSRSGYEVDLAGSVGKALEHLESRVYALGLTDFLLPDRTGLDLVDAVRERGIPSAADRFPDGLRFLLMTAYLEPEFEERVESHPVILDTVRKPMDIFALKTKVDALLRGEAPLVREEC